MKAVKILCLIMLLCGCEEKCVTKVEEFNPTGWSNFTYTDYEFTHYEYTVYEEVELISSQDNMYVVRKKYRPTIFESMYIEYPDYVTVPTKEYYSYKSLELTVDEKIKLKEMLIEKNMHKQCCDQPHAMKH